MEGQQLWIKHKQDWGQRFIPVLPQASVLPGQMLATIVLSQHRVLSSRSIIPRTPYHAQCRLWGTLLRRGLRFVQWRRTRYPIKERDPIVHGRIELPNTESTEPGCIHIVLRVPPVIRPLGNTRLVRSIQLSSRPEIGLLFTMFWLSILFSQVASAV